MSGKYIGDFRSGQVIRDYFNSFSRNRELVSPTLPIVIAVMKEGVSLPVQYGISQPSLDFASRVGLHYYTIDLSADAFYESGKDYCILAIEGTIDGTNVGNVVLRRFSIENRHELSTVSILRIWHTLSESISLAGSIGKRLIDNLNVQVSSRATVSEIESSEVLAKQASFSAIGSQLSELLNRIPQQLFVGISRLSHWIGALAGKGVDLQTRLEINATPAGITYDQGVHSLEAILTTGNQSWGGSQSSAVDGAWVVTILVQSQESQPLEGVAVRLSKPGQSFIQRSNAAGVCLFSVDSGSWILSATANGFGFTPMLLPISSSYSQTIVMVSVSIAAPLPIEGFCNVIFDVRLLGIPIASAMVSARLVAENPTINGIILSNESVIGYTDVEGRCVMALLPTASFTRGGIYDIKVTSKEGTLIHDRRVAIPSQDTCNAEDLPEGT